MKDLLSKAGDGCHRWGWLINLIVMIAMFAYYMGTWNQRITDLGDRLGKLETQVYDLAHVTKGK